MTPSISARTRGVCVALANSIQVLNAEGAVEKTLEFSDAERVMSLAMTTHGLYVLVERPGARRLHFMP